MLEIYSAPLKITCVTGMHIGTGRSLGIGGADNVFIKHPIEKTPYIPGSSLKGRLRHAIIHKYGTTTAAIYFGNVKQSSEDLDPVGASLILVRDANLSEESKRVFDNVLKENRFFELKTETSVNANTGTAASKTLRITERVPAGTTFESQIRIVLTKPVKGKSLADTVKEATSIVKEAVNIVNNLYIGGSGSRGYGWVNMELGAFSRVI